MHVMLFTSNACTLVLFNMPIIVLTFTVVVCRTGQRGWDIGLLVYFYRTWRRS